MYPETYILHEPKDETELHKGDGLYWLDLKQY